MKKSILAILLAGSIISFSCEKEVEKNDLTSNTEQSAKKENRLEVKSTYALDQEQSVAEWSGAGPAAAHQGSFSVSGSDIKVVNNSSCEK